MLKIEFSPVGFVTNQVAEPVDENWGSVSSRLTINPEFAKGITGLDQFSHAVVVTFMNQAEFHAEKHIVRRPRGLATMRKVGIFSQRAKDRPNRIGVTSVKIVSVGDGYVKVTGLDAINGTPILDIKPYYPQYDCIENAAVPDWVNKLMQNYF